MAFFHVSTFILQLQHQIGVGLHFLFLKGNAVHGNVHVRGGGAGSVGIHVPIKALGAARIQIFPIPVIIRNNGTHNDTVFDDDAPEALVVFQ